MNIENHSNLLDILSIYRRNRTSTLAINCDQSGYSHDTYFVITPELKVPLDIRKTVRVLKGKKRLEWTQGRNFQFQEGMVLYDDIAAYTKPWSEALKSINQSIQIKASSNAFYVSKLKHNLMLTGDDDIENKISPSLDLRALQMIDTGRLYYNPGYVKFTLFKPDLLNRKIVPSATYECTQWDFVIFIITGKFVSLENRKAIGW